MTARGEWGIRRPNFGDLLGHRWLADVDDGEVEWTLDPKRALAFATRTAALELAADADVQAFTPIAERFPTAGKTVDNPPKTAKEPAARVDNSPCAWCGNPLRWVASRKGGRPRVRHEECVAASNALTLFERAVDAQLAAGLAPRGSDAKTLRRDLIALAWRAAPGRIGGAR